MAKARIILVFVEVLLLGGALAATPVMPSSMQLWWMIGAGTALVVAVLLTLLLRRKKGESTPAVTEAAPQPVLAARPAQSTPITPMSTSALHAGGAVLQHVELPGQASMAADHDDDGNGDDDEDDDDGEPDDFPTPPASPKPAAFKLKGFTLYERTTKNGPQRFFSKGKPVGKAWTIALPAGAEASWDKKSKRPVLAWTAAPEPHAITAKPCAAIVDVGIFCRNPAAGDGAYCKTHHAYKPPTSMTSIDVTRDRADAHKGKRIGGLAPAFEVVIPRGTPLKAKARSAKASKAHAPTLSIQRDHGTPMLAKSKSSKATKGHAPALLIQRDRGTPQKKGTSRLPRFEAKVRLDKPSVKAFRPGSTWTNDLRVRKDQPKRASGKPIRLDPASMVVRHDVRKIPKPAAMKVVHATVRVVPRSPPKAWKLKGGDDFEVVKAQGDLVALKKAKEIQCVAQQDGRRCSNMARPGLGTCKRHVTWHDTTKVEVARDSKARTQIGLGGASRSGRNR